MIVNLPPRSAKSYIFSIMLTPWAWAKWPWLKFMGSSYDQNLSNDHNLKARRVIESPWYQSKWGRTFRLTTDQNEKKFFENDKRGHRIAVSVDGGIAGKGCDIAISDDDLDVKAARSGLKRKKVKEHYGQGLSRRINDKATGGRIIVHQRLHEDDLTGSEMRTAKEDYQHICIPAEECDAIAPPQLKENYRGGLFFPDHFSKAVLDGMRKSGARDFSAQFNQKPGAEGGTSFPRDAWRFYRVLPERFDKVIASWDMSFKKAEDASYTVGQIWGKVGEKCYLIHQWRKQCGFPEAKKAVIQLSQMFPRAIRKLIEDKANGIPIIQSLKDDIPGICPVEPEGEKLERAEVHADIVQNGLCYVAHPDIDPSMLDFIDEFVILDPKGVFDQVDCWSQAMDELYGRNDVKKRLEALLLM